MSTPSVAASTHRRTREAFADEHRRARRGTLRGDRPARSDGGGSTVGSDARKQSRRKPRRSQWRPSATPARAVGAVPESSMIRTTHLLHSDEDPRSYPITNFQNTIDCLFFLDFSKADSGTLKR
jgi:hypothetical protein